MVNAEIDTQERQEPAPTSCITQVRMLDTVRASGGILWTLFSCNIQYVWY